MATRKNNPGIDDLVLREPIKAAQPSTIPEACEVTPTPAELLEACEACHFYSLSHKACRRFPQHITKHAHEWCGEFSR